MTQRKKEIQIAQAAAAAAAASVAKQKQPQTMRDVMNSAFGAYAQQKTQQGQQRMAQAVEANDADDLYMRTVKQHFGQERIPTRALFANTLLKGYKNATPQELAPLVGLDANKITDSAWEYITSNNLKGGRGNLDKATVDMYSFVDQYRRAGAFDNEDNIRSGQTFLLSDDYIQQMLGTYGQAKQEQEKRRNTNLADMPGVMEYMDYARNESIYNPTLMGAQGQDGGMAALRDIAEGDADKLDAMLEEILTWSGTYYGKTPMTVEELYDIEDDEEFLRVVDEALNLYQNTPWDTPSALTMNEENAAYDLWMQNLSKEQKQRETLNAFAAEAYQDPDYMQKSQYTGSKEEAYAAYGLDAEGMTSFGSNDKTNPDEQLYHYINGNYHPIASDPYYYSAYTDKGYHMLGPDEKALFNYYYKNQSPERAKEYLAALQPTLNEKKKNANQKQDELYATDPLTAAPMWLAEGLMLPADAALGLVKAGYTIAGQDASGTTLNRASDVRTNAATARQEAIQESNMGPVLKTIVGFADQVASAARDMGVAIAIGGNFGGAASKVSGGIMAASATSADLTATLDDDMSPAARLVRAGLTGALEMATEKYSIETLLKNPKTLRGYILQNIVTEGTEEVASSIGGTIADEIISRIDGSKSDLQTATDRLVSMGYKREDAQAEVLLGFMQGVGMEFLVGGATGGFAAAPVAGITYSGRAKTGKAIAGTGSVDNLLSIGQSMQEGSESKQISDKLAAEKGKNKQPSMAEVGRLYQTLKSEIGQNYHKTLQDEAVKAVAAEISAKLEKFGFKPEGGYTVEQMAQGIVAMAGDGTMSDGKEVPGKLQRYINTHAATMLTMREFTEGTDGWRQELDTRAQEMADEYTARMDELEGMLGKKEPQKTAEEPGQTATDTTSAAQAEEVNRLTERSENRNKPSLGITYTEDGQEKRGELKAARRTPRGLEVTLQGEDGSEKTITYDDLTGTDYAGVASVVAYANEHAEATDEEISLMLEEVSAGADAEQTIRDVSDAFDAGAYGQAMPKLNAQEMGALTNLLKQRMAENQAQAQAEETGQKKTGKPEIHTPQQLDGEVAPETAQVQAAEGKKTGKPEIHTPQQLDGEVATAAEQAQETAKKTGKPEIHTPQHLDGEVAPAAAQAQEPAKKTGKPEIHTPQQLDGEVATAAAQAQETTKKTGKPEIHTPQQLDGELAPIGETMASSSRSALQVADMDIRRAHNRAETTEETKETVKNGSYGDRVMTSVTNLIGMVNDARKAKRSKAVEKANDLAGTIRDAYWQLTTRMNRMLQQATNGMQRSAEEAETPTMQEEATEGLIAAAREARKAAGHLFDAAAKGAEKAISNAQKAYEAARDEFIRRYHEAAALVEGGAEVLTEEGFTAETAEEAQEQESTVQYSDRNAGEAEETDAGAEETAEEEYAGTEAEEAAAEETAETAEETATEAAQDTARKNVIERAYAMGQQYAEKTERARRRGTTGRTKGTGTISYMGNVGNNAGVTDTGERQNVSKIMKRLSSQQAASVEALEQVARATGINMVLYESSAEAGAEIETPNGWYDASNNTVYVDLNSGMSRGGETLVNYAVLKTAAHEMTHYIESNSAEEYARLRDQMRRMLSEQGQDYVQLVRRKMGGGRSLSRSAAEAEVIADACEMMLKNTGSIKRLAQEDPGLVGRIVEFLKAFARRLKRAMEGLTATSREAAALTEVKDGVERYLGDLQKAWDDALVEASKNKPGEGATITKRETVSTEEDAEADTDVPGIEISPKEDSAAPSYSWRTWETSEYIEKKRETAKRLAQKIGVTQKQANKWIDDVTSISAMIQKDIARLDYIPSPFAKVFKSNPEYGGSIDTSTICAKRRLATGTLDAIQNMLGDVAMTRDDFLHIRELMKEKGYEVACGLCFVESSRANLSKYVKQFVDQYNETADVKVTMPEFNTVEGLEKTRAENPKAYEAFERFMGRLAQRKPKLFEKRAEYNGEILKRFRNDETIEMKNLLGGLRINSFSDFEIPHLIDMMQVIMDMSAVGLAGQAYTKVPDFAWALGRTGLKINLSMIAKEVGPDGRLVFDEIEGMKRKDAEALRNTYPDNVGTIVVAFTDEQILAAMADPFIDFIIPFHRSQWTRKDYARLGLPEGTKDYTLHQNEKIGRKRVPMNYMPNEYWDFNISGKENAKAYLEKCRKDGRTPKFAKFLVNNGDGRYSLQPDGSTDGYWKLLIDFKMYDNDGNGTKQMPVRPDFNMAEATRMLEEYKGGHESFPVAQDVVEEFVKDFNSRRGVKVKVGEKATINTAVQYSSRQHSAPSMRQTLAMMEPTADMNQTEKYLLGKYKGYAQELSTLQQQMAEEDAILAGAAGDQDEMTKAANRLNILRRKARRVEKLLRTAEQNEGFGRLMDTSRRLVRQVMGESSLDTAAKAAEQRANEAREALQQAQEALAALDEEAQGKLARDLFDVKKLKETAKGLKTSYNSRMSEKALQNRLAMMYTDLYSEDAESGLRFTDALRALAEDLLRTSRTRNSERMDMLREGIGTIRLTDVQKQELKNRGITMKEFRAVVSPVVQITNAETASDLMAAITSSEYFGIGDANGVQALFAGYENEGDAIMRLYDMIREDRAEGINTEGMSEEEAIQATMVDILSNAELPHPGDGAAEATRRAILSMAQAGKEVQGKLDEVMAKMKRSQTAAWEARIKAAQQQGNIKAVAEYYRKLEAHRRALEVAEETQRIQEQLQDTADSEMAKWFKAKELQEKNAALREGIRRTVGWMDKRIRKETDSKRIPEDFKPVVEEMVRMFLSTNDVLRIFKESEAGYIANVYSMLAAHDGTNKRKMESMYEDYKEEMQGVFEELRGLLRDYADASETRKMTERVAAQNEALEGIQDMVNMIWKTAMGIDTTFIGGLETTYAETSAKLADELKKKKAYSRMKGPAGKAWETVKNEIRTGNLTPVYFFRMLGLDTMTTLNDDIHEAQEKHAFLHEAAKKRMQEMQKKYNYWAWKNDSPLTFVTQQGQETNPAKHKVTLTKGEALLIYAIWRRESQVLPLVTSTHLQDGGFVLKTGIREENGKEEYDGTPHKLSAADMRTITDYLTDEQKAFADAVAKYLAKDMGALGNETSMKLFGIRKFKEEYYIPMRVQRDSLAQSSSAGGKNADESSRIMHQSATKRRVNRAYKPLVIGDFLDVAAEHIDKMTLYNTFAIPIENMNRVLNAGYEDETGSAMTVRGQMRQKFGDETVNYLERYIADLNGGIAPDAVEKGLSARAFSKYKRSAVIASASVAIQQPTSIIRAMVEVNPKYFVPVLNHKDNVSMRKEYEQLRKYSGVALIKERGGFDMTSGYGTAQDLKGTLEDDYTFWRKAKLAVGLGAPKGERGAAAVRQWENAFGWLAKKADQVTWTYMWRAVKAETADKHPGMDTSSEEFLKMAGKRFGEVMSLTQVYDSTLVRSQNMRSKTMFAKMLTAFMAEPTLTANMLMDAAQSKDPKKIARASAAYIVGAIATAAAAALVKAGRDDDDEKPWAEKWLSSMGSQLGGWTGSLNPLTLIPGLSDLMNLLDGYDIERADMSMTQDAVEVLNKLIAGKYADNPAKGVEDAAGVIGNMLGIPVKNLWRDVKTVQNTVEGLVNPPREVNAMVLANDAMKNFNLHGINQHDTSIDKYYAKLYDAMKTGNKQEQELLREYLEIQGKDEKTVKTGVRGVVKGKYLDGQITEAEAKNMLLRNGLAKDQQEAFELVDKWREQPAGGMSYSAYDSARAAIRAGNMAVLATEISTLTRNGWDKEAVSRELRTTVREQYMAGKLSKNQVQTMYTKYFAPKNFDVKDNNDWYWLFKELDYGKAHGGNTDGYEKLGDFYKAVETGANIKAVLTDYMAHGYDKSTLSSAITSKYKQEFIRLYKTNRAAAASLQARLLTAYQALGYDRQKKLKDIQEWLED